MKPIRLGGSLWSVSHPRYLPQPTFFSFKNIPAEKFWRRKTRPGSHLERPSYRWAESFLCTTVGNRPQEDPPNRNWSLPKFFAILPLGGFTLFTIVPNTLTQNTGIYEYFLCEMSPDLCAPCSSRGIRCVFWLCCCRVRSKLADRVGSGHLVRPPTRSVRF